jgi:hypothetical protein
VEKNLGLTTFGKEPARGRIGAIFRKPEPGLADRANRPETSTLAEQFVSSWRNGSGSRPIRRIFDRGRSKASLSA